MEPRVLENRQSFSWRRYLLQWEVMLLALFLAINVMNANLSEYYLDFTNLRDAMMGFLDKAFIVLPMVLVMIMGDIDISVGSTVALSAVIMADLYRMGVPMEAAVVICLLTGTVCGWLNGWLIVRFKELSSVIITLATMIIYRGIAYILLEDQAAGGFPSWFSHLGWGYIGPVPIIVIFFAVFAVIFILLLHKTVLGRWIYAIGSNPTSSRYSGVQVDRIKILVFTLTGLMAAVAALFLTARMGSTRPNIATGYELEVIAMVVLGGISTSGGKGRMIGAIIAVFLIGYLRYGLGLINVQAQALLIIIGMLLILAVMLPKLRLTRKKNA
jgi:rhamnose transport system permease protein